LAITVSAMANQAVPLSQLLSTGLQHQRAGRVAEADKIYSLILAQIPDQPDALHLRGIILTEAGRAAEAIELIAKAITGVPNSAQYRHSFGNALRAAGKIDEAIAEFKESLRLNPKIAETHNNLANAYLFRRQLQEAIAAYREAIRLKPDFVGAYANLGTALRQKGQFEESIAAQRQALRLKPHFAQFHANLGLALEQFGRIEPALDEYREAIRLEEANASAHNNLGSLLMKLGQIESALDSFQRSVELKPDVSAAGSNLVFARLFDPRSTPELVLSEHREWAQRVALPRETLMRPSAQPLEMERDADRPLRVGYVSPYLWDHVIARNILPLFRLKDARQFKYYCYYSETKQDEFTLMFQSLCDSWRDIAGLSDRAAAQMIADDNIDILVDLSLHLAGGALKIFSQQPGRVQVAFAGYPGTTALPEMDYRLTDPYLDPPGEHDADYTERSIRLPHSFWCYDPKAMEVEEGFNIARLPEIKNGYITFGCLTSTFKINNSVIDLWSRVLAEVPSSRMILLADPRYFRKLATERFAKNHIDASRIEFVDRQTREGYLHTIDRIDIGLDTFPYNGHTTSLDSLWMGVPVVTLVGKTVVGRAGFCQLSNLGLAHLAANTADEFVNIATKLASDLPALAELRGSMRRRMMESPLTDASGFTSAVEAAYRQMWREYCGKST
jgi:protein O-GlcNAc transferase